MPGPRLGGRGFEARVRGWVGTGRCRRAVTPLPAVLALARTQDEPLPGCALVSLHPLLVSVGLLQFSPIKSEIIGS